jgi:hypothetical protein
MPVPWYTSFTAFLLAISLGVFQIAHGEPAEEKLISVEKISADAVRDYINWIVDQTGWATADAPVIKIVSSDELAIMLLGPSHEFNPVRPGALYSKNERLIFLASTWKKDDILDQSILVHELVHHLQMENHIQLECWGRYEARAYELQIQWLRGQGIDDPYKLVGATRAAIDSLAECN